jgi:hypothetical protein
MKTPKKRPLPSPRPTVRRAVLAAASSLVVAAIVAACGGSDDGDSSSVDGEDPSSLRTATFTAMQATATPLSKKSATTLLAALDLTNYHASTTQEACLNAKAPFVDAVDTEAASASDVVDVTSCFAADAFAPITEVTVSSRAVVRASLQVDGEGSYLVGRDLEYVREELKGDDVVSFDLTRFEQRITEVKGVVDGSPVTRVERRLSQNGDGRSCLRALAKDADRVQVQPCAHFFGWTVTTGEETTESGVAVVRNDTLLEADAFTAPYFRRDARMTISLNDWSGEVVYGGADAEPQYQLTSGEETIETERFGDFDAGLLEVETATSRGGCYVGTTDCDIEISFTLSRDAATFEASEYKVAFAYAEGTTPPAACTAENVGDTPTSVATAPLIFAGVKSRTTYAIRVCVLHEPSGEFSPGIATFATTPELIDD